MIADGLGGGTQFPPQMFRAYQQTGKFLLPETPPEAWIEAMARAITTTELESEKVSQASVEQDRPHARAAYAALRRSIGGEP